MDPRKQEEDKDGNKRKQQQETSNQTKTSHKTNIKKADKMYLKKHGIPWRTENSNDEWTPKNTNNNKGDTNQMPKLIDTRITRFLPQNTERARSAGGIEYTHK
jgi:hypothetical protein